MDRKSYLSRLKFDPKLAVGFVFKYLSNPRLAILILIAITLLGVSSYISLPRNLNPEIKIPIILVSTVLPGAGPKDVESLVTVPIENSVKGVSNIKTVTSSSTDSVSVVDVEFKSGIDPDKARTDIQAAVDTVNNLPSDAQTPKVQKLDFENQPVWNFAVTTIKDLASLTRFTNTLKDQIDDIDSVDRAEINGLETQEIQILIKPDAIATFGVNPLTISQSIKTALSSYPAGSVKSSSSNFSLTINQGVTTLDDIRNLRVKLDDQIVQLSEIANISIKSKPNQGPAYLATKTQDPRRVVSVDIFRNSSAKIDQSIADVKSLLDEKLKENNQIFSVSTVQNVGEQIDDQFNELIRDFIITIILVFITILIFLGARQAIVSTFAIPMTFFISFAVMKLTGISLSFISLFSLLLALGLLVDDTIVVISAITSYYRTGRFSPLEAAILVWRDFLVPILSTTITTVWAFLPLLLSSGIIGEFIKPMPIVVSTTLIASFFVAMFITLPLIIISLSGNYPRRVLILISVLVIGGLLAAFYFTFSKNILFVIEFLALIILLILFFIVRRQLFSRVAQSLNINRSNQRLQYLQRSFANGFIHFDRFSNRYRNLISNILSSKRARIQTIVMVLVFTLFSLLLLPLGFVQNEFFPKSNEDFISVTLELPPGTSLDITNKEALVVLNQLRDTPELEFVNANVGQAPSGGFGGSSSSSNNASFALKLHKKSERKTSSNDISEQLRQKFKDYQKGKLSVVEASGGPPAGADLQIKLFGEDLNKLDQYGDKIQNYLKTQAGVTNVDKSIKPGTSKVVFVPNKDKMIQEGLSADSVGLWLRTYASGFDVDKLKLEGDRDDTDITLRFNSGEEYIDKLGSIYIQTETGSIPLLSLGTLTLEPNPTLITRENNKRTISVTGGARPGYSVGTLNKDLENYAKSLNLPSGYSWSTGGVNEENQNSVNSILQAMILSFLLIIITMVIQFSSFRKALIVMLVIPLSVTGVFIIFGLTHTPLSFPALIGMLALFGIVVKNSILIVDKITQNIKAGLEFNHAIAEGASSRLEAIALTSFATIMGLLPVTLSDPIWRGLGGAIIAGLTFSGLIMLFFIPTVYYYLFIGEEKRSRRA